MTMQWTRNHRAQMSADISQKKSLRYSTTSSFQQLNKNPPEFHRFSSKPVQKMKRKKEMQLPCWTYVCKEKNKWSITTSHDLSRPASSRHYRIVCQTN